MVQMMMKLTLSKFPPSLRTGSLSLLVLPSPRPLLPRLGEERVRVRSKTRRKASCLCHSFIHASLCSTPHHHATYANCVCVRVLTACVFSVPSCVKLLTVTLTLKKLTWRRLTWNILCLVLRSSSINTQRWDITEAMGRVIALKSSL